MGWQNRVHTYSKQKYYLFYSTRVTSAGGTGRGTFPPPFTHSDIFVHFGNTAQPLSAAIPIEEGFALKFSQAPGSSGWTVTSPEIPGLSQRVCRKISTGKALPSLEMFFYLDQNIPNTITKIKQKAHISSRSSYLCRTGNQWAGQLSWAPLPTRTLLISLSKNQVVHYSLHSQMLVTTFRLDSSLCRQRLPVHSLGN